MSRPSTLPAVLALLLLAGCGAEPPAGTDDPATAAAADAEPTPARAAPADARGADAARPAMSERAAALRERRQARREWWTNEDLASQLGLQPAQQQAIAAAVASHASTNELGRENLRRAQLEYREALASGELERAREAARRHAALVSEQVLRQRMLPIDVLAMLEPEQRTRLVEEHAGLLSGMAQDRPRGERAGRGLRDDDAARGD